MRSLLVAVLVLLSAPAQALATLDVYFETEHYRGSYGLHGLIRAENFEFVMGPNSCNAAVADCRSGPPTTLSLERGGQVVATSQPSARPALAEIPQPGDVVHIAVNGAERGAVSYDGRPSFDGDCSPAGASVSGPLPAGVAVEVRRAESVGAQGEAGSVTTAGERFTAAFSGPLGGTPVQVTGNGAAPAADGGTIGVHVRNWTAISCAEGAGPQKLVHLDISGHKSLRAVRVDRHGRFVLPRRASCPAELPSCRMLVDVHALRPDGDAGRRIARLRYVVAGGTNARVHGRLGAAASAALHRRGHRRVEFSIVIRPPVQIPPGIDAIGVHAGYFGTLRTG
jgi:hypothetical protein